MKRLWVLESFLLCPVPPIAISSLANSLVVVLLLPAVVAPPPPTGRWKGAGQRPVGKEAGLGWLLS